MFEMHSRQGRAKRAALHERPAFYRSNHVLTPPLWVELTLDGRWTHKAEQTLWDQVLPGLMLSLKVDSCSQQMIMKNRISSKKHQSPKIEVIYLNLLPSLYDAARTWVNKLPSFHVKHVWKDNKGTLKPESWVCRAAPLTVCSGKDEWSRFLMGLEINQCFVPL